MQHRMEAVNARRKAEGLAFCELGIGVYTGEVLHGFIGATDHLQYTVIGDTVNMASRYCDGAGAGEIILGPTTLHSLAHPPDVIPCFIKTKHEGDLPAFRAPWKIAH
jgi:adenylate cyclase